MIDNKNLDSSRLAMTLLWRIYEQWSYSNSETNPVDSVFDEHHLQRFLNERMVNELEFTEDDLAVYGLNSHTKIIYYLVTAASFNGEHDSIYRYLQTSPEKTHVKILERRLTDIDHMNLTRYITYYTETAWTLSERLKNDAKLFKHEDLGRQAEKLSEKLDAILK